jgi:hypothetical protein
MQRSFLLRINFNGKQFHANHILSANEIDAETSSLKSLNVGAWVRARPQSALWFHYANRLVISALGPAINELA